MKAGLVSVSFRARTVEEIVNAVKEQNLTHIEWGSDIHAPVSDLQKIEYIAKLCAQNGITVSYGSYFKFGQTPMEELEKYLQATKALGADIMRVWCGVKSSKDYTTVALNALYDDCKRASDLAQKYGVTLATECHNWTLTDELESALNLFSAVNSPAFQTFWQPNQFKSFEENMVYAKAVAPFTKTIHAFAWEGEKRYPLAKHEEIWEAYLSNFTKEIPCLLEFMPDDEFSSLATESASLLKILK